MIDYGTVTGRNLVLSPTFGWNLRFIFSLSSSPTSRKLFQSTRKYNPLLLLVGKTGSGARVVPPKDSSSAARFVFVDVDDAVVDASTRPELSFAESEAVIVVVVVGIVVVGTSVDSVDKFRNESLFNFILLVFYFVFMSGLARPCNKKNTLHDD